jgi:hypothetical protein
MRACNLDSRTGVYIHNLHATAAIAATRILQLFQRQFATMPQPVTMPESAAPMFFASSPQKPPKTGESSGFPQTEAAD